MWALKGLLAQTTTRTTDFEFFVYHVAFHVLLKETGHGSRVTMSKYPELLHGKLSLRQIPVL